MLLFLSLVASARPRRFDLYRRRFLACDRLSLLLVAFLFALFVDRCVVAVLVSHGVFVVVHGVGGVGEVEECVLFFTDVDERGVHPLHDPLDATEENRPYMAFFVLNVEEEFSETLIFVNCDP